MYVTPIPRHYHHLLLIHLLLRISFLGKNSTNTRSTPLDPFSWAPTIIRLLNYLNISHLARFREEVPTPIRQKIAAELLIAIVTDWTKHRLASLAISPMKLSPRSLCLSRREGRDSGVCLPNVSAIVFDE
ncbi:hypothetical protein TorRG33x02_285830 [Trema orientale]|uniref:Uncharacterized protein n=1 Tax=Trema orientale TaxID=63057 RepID=A0A2P5CGC0_TREOI|nr:hypothetical protein TorRG33x02_285830 [Trema orientale]